MANERQSHNYRDLSDPHNGPKHHTGNPCIEGCGRPAGTWWSPLWCQPCNAKRMDRIGTQFDRLRTILNTGEANHGK